MTTSAGYLPPVVVQILGTDKDLLATIVEAKAALKEFAATDTRTQLGADFAPLTGDLAKAKLELLAFAKMVYNARLGADAAPFLADIARLRAEVDAMSPLDLHIDTNIAKITAELNALRGTLASAQTAALLDTALAGEGGGGGGAGGGGLGGLLGNAGGAAALLHTLHLFTPELVGIATALGSVVLGFGALAVASAGAAYNIYLGTTAVDSANKAIGAAIPGTTQWQTGVVALGQAWSSIPAILQPAVGSITTMMQKMGASPLGTEIKQFLGGQAGVLTHLFSGAGNTFAPLIIATEHAVVALESMITKALGSGGMGRLVAAISHMVGPATLELAQLAMAILHIGTSFATAVTDGRGMEVVVTLFQSLAKIVGSSFFGGFVTGWVAFDRILSTVVGLIARLLGALSALGVNMHSVGVIAGFVVSGFLAFKGVAYLLDSTGQKTTGLAGKMNGLKSSMGGVATAAAGFGLMAVGITGLAGDVSTLLHTSNPLSGAWHAIAGAIGLGSKAAGNAVNTLGGLKGSLSSGIPVTANFTKAQDLLVRSMQSIGSGLAAASTGFKTFASNASMTYSQMIANLNAQNTSLMAWAANAASLIKAGVNPSMVASMVNQSPAEVGVAWQQVQKVGSAAINQMNSTWAAHLMSMQVSGKTGMQGVIAAITKALTSGSASAKAGAKQLATALGTALNIPFTGSLASVKAIGRALQTLSPATVSAIAGKMTTLSGDSLAASTHVKAVKPAVQSVSGALISMVPNIAMVAGGFAMFVSSLGGVASALAGSVSAVVSWAATTASSVASTVGLWGMYAAEWISTTATAAASFVAEQAGAIASWVATQAGGAAAAAAHFAVMIAEWVVGAATFVAANVAMAVSATAAFIAENAATLGIIAGLAALVAGIVYVATHWSQVWGEIKRLASDAWHFLDGVWRDIVAGIHSAWSAAINFLSGTWRTITSDVHSAWDAIVHFFAGIPGDIANALGALGSDLAHVATAAWHLFQSAATAGWNVALAFFTSLPGKILGAVSSFGSLLFHAGEALIGGLVKGIKSAVGGVVSAVTHVGSSIVHGITSFFGIGSPSRLMAEMVGVPIAQGIGVGISQGAGTALSAMAGLSSQLLGAGRQLPGAMRGVGYGASAGYMGAGGQVVVNQTVNLNLGGAAAGGSSPASLAAAIRKELDQSNTQLVSLLRQGMA